jgi:hypothetical protein
MKRAGTIWSKETGIHRDPADQIEAYRPDDQRDRFLSAEGISNLKRTLDGKIHRVGTRDLNRTFYRTRTIVSVALTSGMRIAEIFA